MKHLKRFNEKWDYTPGKVAEHELAEEIANDLLPRFQKMREEGKQVTVSDFDKYMEERGATFELSDSVMNILVSNGFDFDSEEVSDEDLPEPYIKKNESVVEYIQQKASGALSQIKIEKHDKSIILKQHKDQIVITSEKLSDVIGKLQSMQK